MSSSPETPEQSGADFARIADSHTVTQKRPFKVHTWVGSKDALIAVQDQVEEVLRAAYEQQAAGLPEPDPDLPDFASKYRWENLRNAYRLYVTVTGKHSRWTEQGDLRKILNSVHLDEIATVTLGNARSTPHGEHHVEVSFESAKPSFQAVSVTVPGPDQVWASGVADAIRERLLKNRPAWWWLRSVFTGFLAVVMIWGPMSVALSRTFIGDELDWATEWSAMAAILAISLLLGLVGPGLMRFVLPAFEVLPPGERSLGGQRIGAIASLVGLLIVSPVLSAVVAIYIN